MVRNRSTLHSVVRAAALLAVAGCGGGTTPPEEPVATTFELAPESLTLTYLGQQFSFSPSVRDQNGVLMRGVAVTFETSDASIATMTSDGQGEAVANGTATITATAGNLMATSSVTVVQEAARVFVVSGDEQEAIADSTLADPIVARVQDLGGSPVPDVTVTFTPDSASGSVSTTTAVSDANGEASTTWTLGSGLGPQHLLVATDVDQVEVCAIGRADRPTADLAVATGPAGDPCGEVAVADLVVERPDPSSLEEFVVRTTIRNDGDLESGSVDVRLLANDVEIETQTLSSVAPGEEVQVEFVVGPLAAGAYGLRFVVDPDDAIVELNEVNNASERALSVVEQAELTAGVAAGGLAASGGGVLLFRLEVPQGSPDVLTIELSGGSGDADLFVQREDRPSGREEYESCLSYNPTNDERCQFTASEGTYHVLLYAWVADDGSGGFSGASLTASLGDTIEPFDIELVFIDPGTPSQDSAFARAAARWEELIVGDLSDIDLTGSTTLNVVPEWCVETQPSIGAVDDLRIYVLIEDIDGPFQVLGSANYCLQRAVSEYEFQGLPFVGVMRFDEADLLRLEGDGDLDEVILHEMGHVLGLGTTCHWAADGVGNRNEFCPYVEALIEAPSLPESSGADTHFTGVRTTEAFNSVGGIGYVGAKVPVENNAVEGSSDSHWRESVFDTELMTPSLDGGGVNQLSRVTVEQFADIGYQVAPSGADPYTLPVPLAGPARAAGERRVIDLSGDVMRIPALVVNRKGEVVRVIRR